MYHAIEQYKVSQDPGVPNIIIFVFECIVIICMAQSCTHCLVIVLIDYYLDTREKLYAGSGIWKVYGRHITHVTCFCII